MTRWTWLIDCVAAVGIGLVAWGLDVLGCAIGVGPALMLLFLGAVLAGGALWTSATLGRLKSRKGDD